MQVDDIRKTLQAMQHTTPEAELLGCIALAVVQTLESVMEVLEALDMAAAADEWLVC